MPVASSDFIAFAEGISLDGSEIDLRAMVSRAYYGAYHACRDWHETTPPQPGHNVGKAGGIHQQLINQLTNPHSDCSDEMKFKSRQLAYTLAAVKVARTLADYRLAEPLTREQAANFRTNAKGLVARAQQQ